MNGAVSSEFRSLLCMSFVFSCVCAAVNVYENRPQILIENGHLVLQTGDDYNITLRTRGRGAVNLNDDNLVHLAHMARNATSDVATLQSNVLSSVERRVNNLTQQMSGPNGLGNRLLQFEQAVSRITALETSVRRIDTLETQVDSLRNNGDNGEDQQTTTGQSLRPRLRRLENRVQRLTTQFNQIRNILNSDECSSRPCRNGGTCINTYNSYFCFCPENWEGADCDIDVNECSDFAGTDLGCQNGATCQNKPGTYECHCRPGFFGIHCTQRSDDCSSGSSYELCGHGTCVNQHSGGAARTCFCDMGWTKDNSMNPMCTRDKDECAEAKPPCSTDPPVPCYNTPGSFHCGPCPAGYSGNGHHCDDINECLVNNGGCSINPSVECRNTKGGRECGPCPPGYSGDGISCTLSSVCRVNNGGCHYLAACRDNPMVSSTFVQCTCPPGYIGNGFGPYGCISSGSSADPGVVQPNPCNPNPCVHGTCTQTSSTGYHCSCMPGYTGSVCNIEDNPCQSNPCQHGGTCVRSGNTFHCTCTTDYTGTVCQEEQQACGGFFMEEEGSFRFPHGGSIEYPHNIDCKWIIVTTPGMAVNVTFPSFHLEADSSCNYDWLQIYDGPDVLSTSIGKFCGTVRPFGGHFVSTHNSLTLNFRSDHSVSGQGFEVHWTTTDPVCGGNYANVTHGTINSPGYPGQYPHDRDCYWTISLDFGKRIQFMFATLQIEEHMNCSYDFLEIRDGLNEADPSLTKVCTSVLPQPLTSSGPHALIHFHTDSSQSSTGFHITFAAVEGVPGCGGLLTNVPGYFSSPGHPEPYGHNMICEWVIRLLPDEKILLTFVTFELEHVNDCAYDSVEIRDGDQPNSPLVGMYCGDSVPPTYKSLGNKLFIRFKSDYSVQQGGFMAKYDAVCGGTYGAPTGIFHSPYHPGAYPANRECIYVISQPVGVAIRLDWLAFDVEQSYGSDCIYDYVEVRDGHTENSTLIGHYCGSEDAPPPSVISSYNYLWIKFKTDASVHNTGFLANYSTFEVACGGILHANHGIITSPEHPNVYPNGIRCQWVINVEPGKLIQLHWLSFHLENNPQCAFDSISVFDNSTMPEPGSLMGKFCGSTLPATMTSSGEIITVIFVSDHSVAHDGFMASYITLNASTACGGNYYTESGIIKSPGYPDRHYGHDRTCAWMIQVPTGRQIMLNITDFDLEHHVACTFDYLEIRNGGYESSPLIGTYCGNSSNIPPLIPSFSNQMYLKFKSDSSLSARGFQITWDGTATGCGGTLTGTRGSFTSPYYPSQYGHASECFWKITTNMGSFIQLIFADLDLEHHVTCQYDYVEVYDGPNDRARSLGRFCDGSVSLTTVNSTGSSMWVKFRSDYSNAGRGFLARYMGVCNKHISGRSGVIESPNFPNLYPHNRNCTWVINAPPGNKINATFSHFDVEEHQQSNCQYDYIELKESQTLQPGSTSIGKYCGGLVPPARISTGTNHLFINFVSDHSVAHNGFRLEWKVYGCGEHFRKPSGEFTSPNYPMLYHLNMQCNWYITVDPGNSVQLNITTLDIELVANCVFDFVAVFGGIDDSSPLLGKYCQKTTSPIVLTSSGNNMLIRFVSDSAISGRGFQMTYTSIPQGCGGYFKAPNGVIHSPNYPQHYGNNDDCVWIIETQVNHVVELEFTDFDVEPATNCSYDHVAMYDGDSISAPLLAMYCGSNLPSPKTVVSTGNKMYIRLKADGSNHGKGFSAKYQMGCGARIVTEDDGELTSPEFPHQYTRPVNCTWIIIGAQPSDHVTLTFTHMDLQTDFANNCTRVSAHVHDGLDANAPLIATFCGNRVPSPIVSQGSALYVRLFSNESWYGTGFRAVYSVANAACGGNFTSDHGTFATPGFPNSYPPNVECIWNIAASVGGSVQVTFRSLEIEESEHCNDDYLEIHERSAAGRLLGHFCGSTIPTNITAENGLWIKFRSNNDGAGKGFIADYSLLHSNELFGSIGEIKSPNYPNYNRMEGEYTWRITVSRYMAISVVLQYIYIEHQVIENRCAATFVVYDGYDDTSPELYRSCQRMTARNFTSTSNVVYVKYATLNVHMSSIFYLNWLEVPATYTGDHWNYDYYSRYNRSCGGIVPLNGTANITSPGYPHGYKGNLLCTWHVEASIDRTIQITAVDMDLEGSWGCWYDMLKIYFGENRDSDVSHIRSVCSRNHIGNIAVSTGNYMRLEFQTDLYRNGSGFLVHLEEVCGGNIATSSGIIRSPRYPDNYPPDSTCDWVISVARGKRISVTFELIDIFGPENICGQDYLMFRNGESIYSPLLGSGKYCGTTNPDIPETVGNKLHIRFVSQTGNGRGFKLQFREIRNACGGQIVLSDTLKSFSFTSPNFPSIPHPHTECEWVFLAPAGESIALDFEQSFDLTSSYGCTEDFVEVRNGGSQESELLGRFCDSMPGTQYSTANALYVRYFTDVTDPKNGFKARASINVCGGTLVGMEGSVMSPNYPQSYAANLNCTWTLRGPIGHFLRLEITDMELPWRRDCSRATDKVVIQEKINGTYHNLGTYCSSATLISLETSLNEVRISFLSGAHTQQYRGFRIKYNVSLEECGGSLTAPSGIIQSPNYPNGYGHSRFCMWNIVAAETRQVHITMLDLDLPPVNDWDQCSDYITFTNGDPQRHAVIAIMCGSALTEVDSMSNELSISYFQSTAGKRGFKLQYSTDMPAICGGVITQQSGWISSPGYPDIGYNNSVLCKWHFRNQLTDINSTIVFTFLELHLEICPYDTVTVEGGVADVSTTLATLCDTKTQVLVASPYPYTLVKFWTDHSVVHKGFNMTYNVSPCGGLLSGPYDTIGSPNYPNNYPSNTHCAWIFKYDDGVQIQITFTEFALENNCNNDYIKIYNGPDSSAPLLGTFCGPDRPDNFVSNGNNLYIEFHSNGNMQAKGFRFTAEPLTSGCGGIYLDLNGQLKSPNFPATYPNSAECEWEIRIDNGFHVNVTFTERFDIETSNNCTNDFVELFDKPDGNTWNSVGRYCGKEVPTEAKTSAGNEMRVLFRSNEARNGDGFKINWSYFCGGTYRDKEGYIESPGYPLGYTNNLDCVYVIQGNVGEFITVEFEDMDIEAHDYCNFDSLVIYEGNTTYYHNWLGQFCNSNNDTKSISVRSSMYLRFRTDLSVVGRGFRLKYFKNECGGNITEPTEIRSPAHQTKFSGALNCTWQITAPENKIIILRFKALNLQYSTDCYYGYVGVYNGTLINNDQRLGLFCGGMGDQLLQIKSTGNTMLVNLKENVYSWSGYVHAFIAVAEFVLGPAVGCGGTVNVTQLQKEIKAPQASDGNYEPYLDCEWVVVGAAYNSIKLEFTAMNVEIPQNEDSCPWDYVEVRDGPGQFSPLMGKYCGTTVPPILHSSRNYLWVRFVSDSSHNKPGFTAKLSTMESACGPMPVLNASYTLQELQSPNYPNNYPLNMRCQWIIDAQTWQNIHITFEDFSLEDSSSCVNDWLEIRNIPHLNRRYMTSGPGPLIYSGEGYHRWYHSMGNELSSYDKQHKFCGNLMPHDIMSLASTLEVTFVSNGATTGHGFKLKYDIAGCSRTYRGLQGQIYSPRWPNKLQYDTCTFIIEGDDKNGTLSVNFNTFGIAETDNCDVNYLRIRDGNNSQAPVLAKLCGLSVPNPVFGSGPQLFFELQNSAYDLSSGYDITYFSSEKESGCGGTIYNTHGSFTSPGYPGNYSTPSDCRWNVEVPGSLTLQIEFKSFHVGNSTSCTSNYVEILSLSPETNTEYRHGKYCGMQLPAIYITDVGAAAIRYVTSTSNTGTGWRVVFTGIYPEVPATPEKISTGT